MPEPTPNEAKGKRRSIGARPDRYQANLTSVLGVLLATAIVVMVNYLSLRHYYRTDWSPTRLYTLTEKTRQVLGKLEEPLRVTTYFAPARLNPSKIRREIEDLLKEYQVAAGGKIIVENIDPALHPDKALEMARKFNFGEDENLVIFEYKDRHRYLREAALAEFEPEFMGKNKQPKMIAFKGEPQFTGAILGVIEGKPSRVYFLEGHQERSLADATGPSGIGKLAAYVKRDNIEVVPLNLATRSDVPEDADALAIVGPRESLNTVEVEAVAAYLANRGKVLLFQDAETTSGLESLTQKYGLKLDNDRTVAPGVDVRSGRRGMTQIIAGTDFADHPAVKSLRGLNLLISQARSITLLPGPDGKPDRRLTALLKTPQGYWGETNLSDMGALDFDPATDLKGPLVVAALYDGGLLPGEGVSVTDARLMVMGSSYFLSNLDLSGVGVDFFTNTLNWMLQKDVAVGINPKFPAEYSLNVSPLQLRTINTLAMTLLPGAALCAGLFVWYSRRK
jgi:ABC-type uncharacterized transport system